MDWDDVMKPKAKTGPALGESLETLSVAELQARIQALKDEIGRVEIELARKQKQKSAADALFKS